MPSSGTPTRTSTARPRRTTRFSDWLRQQAGVAWSAAVNHRFTREFSRGRLEETVFKRYLINEYSFVEASATVTGYAIAYAPSIEAKAHLAAAVYALTTEQREYFTRAFSALGIPGGHRTPHSLDMSVMAFRDMVIRTAAHGGYEDILATMLAAEWLYLTWSTRTWKRRPPPQPYYREWVKIHVSPAFQAHVAWMRAELDTVGPDLPLSRQVEIAHVFRRTLEMEVFFHDAAYTRGGTAR